MEEEFLRKEVVRRTFSKIKKRVKRLEFVHVSAAYRRLFTDWHSLKTPEFWDGICMLTKKGLSNGKLTWEDATPYLYLKGRILGDQADRSVRHLLIDEAQDYSAFQFAYMKHIYPYTKLTLLGDINQSIYNYATKKNPLVREENQLKHERITLTKSYRSTREIVEFTKHFAPGKELIEPFERKGEKPTLLKLDGKEGLTVALRESVVALKRQGHETIAVICKTMQESEMVYHQLQDKLNVLLINEETYSFEKGLLVLPVYLAKGIEFDAVLIPDASEDCYYKESDRAILYTACTYDKSSYCID
ncbi:UvrD-helicase domain-containing protein [Oceanobacillus damuensis]|uniref:UvrD-helicase domain-containing protein n=1 Tax=Oceanobacillus damuensis TaxID=937928 RepID=UPI00082BA00F|nr:UvrD-helicase domain-containing protein [Oceanobacillus damuensis]